MESAAYEADIGLKNVCNEVDQAVKEADQQRGDSELFGIVQQLQVQASRNIPDIKLKSSEVAISRSPHLRLIIGVILLFGVASTD